METTDWDVQKKPTKILQYGLKIYQPKCNLTYIVRGQTRGKTLLMPFTNATSDKCNEVVS